MATNSSQKIKYLVADTTAFINAVPLNEYADNVLTVPEVVAEVKNKRQMRRLCVLPFDLQVREPRIESVKHCVEFAKKTGDYASLSGIDIKVVALTYELEAENVGTDHLRKEPVVSRVVASKDKPEEFRDKTKLVGWYSPKDGEEEESDEYEESDDSDQQEEEEKDDKDDMVHIAESEGDAVKDAIEKQLEDEKESTNESTNQLVHQEDDDDEVTQQQLEALFEKLKCEPPNESDDAENILVPQAKHDDVASNSEDDAEEEEKNQPIQRAGVDVEEDGWITPANIKKAKKSLAGREEDNVVPLVSCMSTDFAVQNVLKQLNLQISALNGRVIKHLRTYILRCYACFKTTSIMTKVFCPSCGNKTLKRVAVSLDENGKQVIHINTRRPLTTKYKNQSLPRFKGGKHSRNPILFEDQPIPRQMPSRVAKTKTNALDEDYIAGFSPFAMRDVDSKSAMLRSKGHVKEWARNNTFEEDRRKKNYNRWYK